MSSLAANKSNGLVVGGSRGPTGDHLSNTAGTLDLVPATLVETSQNWPPVWTPRPEVEALFATRGIGRTVGAARLRRRYGPQLLEPGATAAVTRGPLRLAGHWVQIKLLGRGTPQVIWAGRISDEADAPFGTPDALADTPAGQQEYVAYGPLRLWERTTFSHSWWQETGGTPKQIGWLPDFNIREQGAAGGLALQGNRSELSGIPAGQSGESYLFGGARLWSALDALNYLLFRIVNPQLTPAPFVLGGQFDTLSALKEFVPISSHVENAAELLERLIPERYGLSWFFAERLDAAGDLYAWELRVISLLPRTTVIGGITFGTEAETRLDLLSTRDVDVIVERSTAQRYRTIRAVGERVVSCFSIGRGANGGALRQGWDAVLETAYNTLASDQLRTTDLYRDVYQVVQIPANFNFANGMANPNIPDSGNPTWSAAGQPGYQKKILVTLPKMPLFAQYDYSTSTPTAPANPPAELEFRPPLAIGVVNITGVGDQACPVENLRAISEAENVSVAPLENGLGVRLHAARNHELGLNHFGGTSSFSPAPTTALDWTQLTVTLACELDQRLTMETTVADVPGADLERDGATLVVHVPDAHFWWLTPGTIVDVDAGTSFKTAPGTGTILRDDRYKLALALAGAVGRFQRERFAATVRIRQIAAWNYLLGKFLATVYRPGSTLLEKSQVTSVLYDFSTQFAELRVGGDR